MPATAPRPTPQFEDDETPAFSVKIQMTPGEYLTVPCADKDEAQALVKNIIGGGDSNREPIGWAKVGDVWIRRAHVLFVKVIG